MSKAITTLPVGSYVKDMSTLSNGVPIKWRILDFNHPGYPTGTVTLFAWNAKKQMTVLPETTTMADKTYRDLKVSVADGAGKIGDYLDTFYDLLGAKLKGLIVDTPLDTGYSGAYSGSTTSFKKQNHKIFLFGGGENNYGGSTYLSFSTEQKKFPGMTTYGSILYQALGLTVNDQPFLSRDIRVSTSDYYRMYAGYINGSAGDYATSQKLVNIFPMMNVSTADLTVLDNPDTDGSYVLNLVENKFLIQDGLDIKGYGGSTNRKSVSFGEGYGEFKGLASQLVNRSFSISFWIKTPDAANNVVLETNLQNNGYHFQTSPSDTTLSKIGFGAAIDPTKRAYSKKIIADNQWHHICGVVDISAKKLSLYVDGLLEGSVVDTNINTITGMVDLGVASRKGAYPIKGNLSQLGIWNKALTDAEVLSVFQNMPVESDTRLVALYPMEEGIGSAIIDMTKKQLDGLLSGAYTWVDEATPTGVKTFLKIGDAPATKSMFDVYGLKDFTLINSLDWSGLTATMPEVLCWTDDTNLLIDRYVHTTVIPKGILLKMNQSIPVSELNGMRLDATVAGANIMRVALSGDEGATWVGANGTMSEITAAAVTSAGFTLAQLNALTKEALNNLFKNGKVMMAIYLERLNLTDALEVKGWFASEIKYILTPAVATLEASYEMLNKKEPLYYVSRNAGAEWMPIKADELIALEGLPTGQEIRVKVVISDGLEFHAISYSWT